MNFLNDNMQVIIAAVVLFVILLIVMALWRTFSSRISGRRGQRLGISEYHELDKTRRLVLIRRDNVEHLILIGGPQDVVVESGITTASIAASYAPQSTESREAIAPAPPLRPAPRPAVFGDRKPPPLRSIDPDPPAPRFRDGDNE
jgi:Flagellar biosynthesis protein, FliO